MTQYFSDMSNMADIELGLRPDPALVGLSATPSDFDEHGAGTPWMHPEFIDAIARRVVELGGDNDRDQSATGNGLLTVSEVARRLNVSHGWVYAHKRDLGAIRLGGGPKARLRFDIAAVLEELKRRNGATGAGASGIDQATKRRPRRLVSRPLPRASPRA